MSSDNDFDEVMRRMGVRRLDDQGRSSVKKATQSMKSAPQAPTGLKKKPQGPPQETLDAPSNIPSSASVEVSALRRERKRLLEEIDQLRQREQDLQSELNGLKSIEIQGIETVQGVLQDWQIRGGDELNQWIKGLTELGRFSEFLSYLKVGHSGLLRKLVDETSVFHCERNNCLAPDGMAILSAATSDCEICGGLDPEPWGARLSEALLLSGKRKVVLRGRRVALLRHLAGQMDSRIQVQVVGLSVRYAVPDSSTWVALWRRSGEDTEGIEANCRVKAASIGQWVTRVVYRLEKE